MVEEHFCLDDSPEFRMVELGDVTSTNDFLRNYQPVGPERRLTLVTAEYQTAGRGAGDNFWESRRSENLLFSMLVHPRYIRAERMFVLSEVLSLAIRDALSSFTSQPFSIKWPNDIYWGNKKICGMLIENDLRGYGIENCVMGAGININQREFDFDWTHHDGLRRMAEPVSLAQIVGEDIERRFVLEKVIENFTRYYSWAEEGRAKDLHELYLSNMYRRGEQHAFCDKDGEFQGTITDVEPTGHLIIVDETGVNHRYAFKEVEYV